MMRVTYETWVEAGECHALATVKLTKREKQALRKAIEAYGGEIVLCNWRAITPDDLNGEVLTLHEFDELRYYETATECLNGLVGLLEDAVNDIAAHISRKLGSISVKQRWL